MTGNFMSLYLSKNDREPRHQAFIFHPGNWYVKYPDGNSMLMPRSTAHDYAAMFGGVAIRRQPMEYPA